MYGQSRAHLGKVLRGLAQHKESRIEEGHLMPDHVHMMICDTAEIFGIQRGGVYQRQECHSSGAGVFGAQEKLCGAKFLGQRVLCLDSRQR